MNTETRMKSGASLAAMLVVVAAFPQSATAQTSNVVATVACADGSLAVDSSACPPETTRADEIVVTGSRIPRRGTETTSPIQTLDASAIEARGFTTVAQALNELPAFGVPGASPVGFNQSGFGAGQSFVDFLGLGSQRTLTLVNGRRFVSANTPSIFGPTGSGGSQVDLNTIPTKLIERVETVAAIGAPIYGSDAVAGTINIILRRDFQGVDADIQYGISDQGDAPDYRIRFLAGQNFADGRGNITVSGEYNEARGLLFTDRALTRTDDRFARSRTPGGARQAIYPDNRVPSISPFGIPLVGGANVGFDLSLSPQQSNLFFGDPTLNFGVAGTGNTQLRFAPDGTLIPIDFGSTVGLDSGFSVFTSGGNGFSLRDVENLLTDLKRYNGNVNLSYELSDNLRVFGEGWYSVSEGRNLASQPVYNSGLFGSAGSRDGNLIVSVNNPFLSAAARSAILASIADNPLSDQNNPFGDPALDGITQDYFYLGRANVDLSSGVSTGRSETIRGVVGIEGEANVVAAGPWHFEASFNYGRARTSSRNPELNQQNFLNAIDAVRNSSGAIVCAPGSTNSPIATLSSTCAPINLFGAQISDAARAYVTTVATPVSLNQQYDGIVSIAGPLVALPGGDLSFALGYEHREDIYNFDPGAFYFGTPDPDPTVDSNGDGDPTNDRDSYGRSTPIDPVYGKFVTNEIFGELNAAIIGPDNDVPFVREFSIQTAGRYVWNSVAGGAPTYTFGLRYAPVADIAFRGAYTRAIRSPSVTEAFNPRSSSFVFAVDPCDMDQVGNGPDPATRARNCAAAGVPADFSALSDDRSFPGYVFGNANLQNETADSYTVGAVFSPTFIPRLTATVDYVDITLKNAISQFSTDQVVAACYDSTTFPGNPFCSLIQRDASSQLNLVGTSYFNSASLRYRGILADVHYSVPTSFIAAQSSIRFDASYQYLDTLTNRVTSTSAPTVTDNSIGYSRHKGVLTVGYDSPAFSYQVQAAYIGSAKIDNDVPANFYPSNRVAPILFVNMGATARVNDQFTLRLDVDNVFNQAPPSPYPASGGTTTYFRGILGRYFRISAGVRF